MQAHDSQIACEDFYFFLVTIVKRLNEFRGHCGVESPLNSGREQPTSIIAALEIIHEVSHSFGVYNDIQCLWSSFAFLALIQLTTPVWKKKK